MPSLIVVGSINQDAVALVERHPLPGETVLATSASVGLGGKGCNQAVAARLAGAAVTMVGAVGADAAGNTALATLADFGVETSGVARLESVGTGVAYITVDASGENSIVVASGANAVISPEAVLAALDGITDAVLLLQGELPESVTTAIATHARQRGLRLILNLAPVSTRDPDVIRTADPLIVNESEAVDLLGAPAESEAAGIALRDRYGVDVIVTVGAAGALLVTADGVRRQPSPRPAAVVDTTGAGDAFVGVLAAGLCAGLSLDEAAVRAVTAASHSVSGAGTVGSYATSAEIDALVTIA